MKGEEKIKLAIVSGKGGVGKSMLASALAMLFAEWGQTPLGTKSSVVAVDCDVDAPNLAIWLGEPGNWKEVKKISVSEKPIIDNSKVGRRQAELCAEKCRFKALRAERGKLKLNPFLCEGCGACEIFCPSGTIKMEAVKSGEIRTKKTKYNFPLVSGQLYPGETGSGKIVTEIKKQADKFDYDIQIIDSAPGTGCPVTAALRDASFAVLVTEPTLSGFTDLKRALKVIDYFNIPWKLVINKWDINRELAGKIEKEFKNKMLGRISYDKKIFRAISQLRAIMETNLKAKKEIKRIYNNLNSYIRINS